MSFVKGKSGHPEGRPKRGVEKFARPRINWAQIMVDLHNAGCTANRVACHLKVAHCTTYNWVKGGEPKYGSGRALLRLHAHYCGSALTISRLITSTASDLSCFSTTSALGTP